MIIFPTYNKFFHWNRMYDIKYDLTRTLKLDFTVNSKANIDEPAGKLSKSDPLYKEKIDTIWKNVWDEIFTATEYIPSQTFILVEQIKWRIWIRAVYYKDIGVGEGIMKTMEQVLE